MIGYVLGAVFGLGVLLVIDGLLARRRPPRATRRRAMTEVLATTSTRTLAAAGGGAAGVLAAMILTHWVALAAVAGVLGALAPGSIAKARAAKRRLARQEALAVVADRLRNAVRSGRDLPEAIIMAADAAPPALRAEMATLKGLLRRRGTLDALEALAEASEDAFMRRFARTLAAAYQSGSRLATVLAAVADASWLETRTAREIRTRQTSIRIAANVMGVLPLATLLYLKLNDPAFLVPYSRPEGQLVMLAGFGLVGTGWWAARALGGLRG